MKQEYFDMCKHVAQELKLYASTDSYKCPVCGKILEWENKRYNEENSSYTCPHCANTFADDDLEAVSLFTYFSRPLDIEYRVGKNREYRGVCVTVVNDLYSVYIDTKSKRVQFWWWDEEAHYWLDDNLCDEIDDIFRRVYDFF